MHPLKQQINDLRKYHEALGTKLANLERHLEADEVLQAPTMERQNYAVSSDGSVMHEGKRYSFLYKGIAIENVLIQEVKSNSIGTDGGDYVVKYIYHVREVKEPAKEWEIVEFKCIGKWDGKDGLTWIKDGDGTFGDDCKFSEQSMLEGHLGSVKDGRWAIHAVLRLSDGTVWRVEAITTNGRITGFEIRGSNLMVIMDNGYSYPISLLTEAKALFTTADGVQVPDGATVWFWNSCTEVEERIADSLLIPTMHYSTREAAQSAYDKWLFEQPVLTLRDLEFRGISGHQWGILKQFVKDKISKK